MHTQKEVIKALKTITEHDSLLGSHVYCSDGTIPILTLEHLPLVDPAPVAILCESMHYLHGAYPIPHDPMEIMDSDDYKTDGKSFKFLKAMPYSRYVLIYYAIDSTQSEKAKLDYYQID